MERRPNLVRRTGLAALALLLVGGLSACGGEGPVGQRPAATVDGHAISADEVLDLTKAYDRFYRQEAKRPKVRSLATSAIEAQRGDGAETYDAAAASTSLAQLIQYQVVSAELDRLGLEITDADRKAALDQFETNQTGDLQQREGLTEAEAKKVFAGMDDELKDFTVASGAAEAKLKEHLVSQATKAPKALTDEQRQARLDELYQGIKDSNPRCVSVAYSLDQQAAQANRDRVEAGEAFADVAAQTVNPSSGGPGGSLGCGGAEQVNSVLQIDATDAEAGDLFGPVDLTQTQLGAWVVIRIDSTEAPALDEVRDDLEAQIDDEQKPVAPQDAEAAQLLSEREAKLVAEADITIDPRYGSLDDETGRVVPPVVPGTTTTTQVLGTDPAASGS